MKKLITLLAVVVLSIVVFAACSSPDTKPIDQKTDSVVSEKTPDKSTDNPIATPTYDNTETTPDSGSEDNTGTTPDSGSQQTSQYKDSMIALLSVIEDTVHQNKISILFDSLDSSFSKKAILIAEFTDNTELAFQGIIPIVSSAFSRERSFDNSAISLEYVSEDITGEAGKLVYSVKENDTKLHDETIDIRKEQGKWIITSSETNYYFQSIYSHDLYETIPFVSDISKTDLSKVKSFKRGKYVGLCTDTDTEIMKPFFSDYCGDDEGVLFFKSNDKLVLVDSKEKIAIDLFEAYIVGCEYANGYMWLKYNGKWGAINFTTYDIIMPDYGFDGGYIIDSMVYLTMTKNNKYGLIRGDGLELVPFIYDDMGRANKVKTGKILIPAKKGDYWGVIDSTNNAITDFIYSLTGVMYRNDVLSCNVNGAYGILDENGSFVIRPNKDNTFIWINDYYIAFENSINVGEIYTQMADRYFLYDYSGKRRLTDYAFTEDGILNDIYLSDGSILVPGGYDKNYGIPSNTACYRIDNKSEECVDILDNIANSIAAQYPDTYNDYFYSHGACYYDIKDTKVNNILLVEFNDYTFNLVSYNGDVLLANWIETDSYHPFVYSHYVIYTESVWDGLEYKTSDVNNWYMIDLNDLKTYNIGSTDCLHHYLSMQFQNDSDIIAEWTYNNSQMIYISTNDIDYKLYGSVIDITNKRIITLPEYCNVNYDIFFCGRYDIISQMDLPVVTDGIFYGLIDKNGLVGDGMVYTDCKYDYDTGICTFYRGSESVKSFRVLPDWTAVLVE